MVLAYRLTGIALATWPLLAHGQIAPPDIALVGDVKLALSSSNGTCELAVAEQRTKIKLDLAGPCLFLRRHDNNIGHYRYKKIGTTILIAGTPASTDYLMQYHAPNGPAKLVASDKCSDQAQAIILNGTTVVLTQKVSNELFCPYIGRDEKDYYHFAHYLRKAEAR
jgi:hypothetical protein